MPRKKFYNKNQWVSDQELLDFIYGFFSFQNWSRIITVIVLIYMIFSGFIMNDYVMSRYGSYKKIFCSAGLNSRLKNSVVRIVGGESEGSGFFISEQQILTSFHVIADEPIPKIVLPSGNFITPVKITGDKDADLAILYTQYAYPNLVLNMLEERVIIPNEMLAAAGYPLGTDLLGQATVIKGNYLDYRELRDESVRYIQTNFSLVQGMSGGPLVDMCGNVIGINTFSLSGQSLFISSDAAWEAMPNFTDQNIVKIDYKPEVSSEEAVRAYYNYLKARRMEDGYNLLSKKYRKNAMYDEWTNRFNNIIDVDVVSVKKFKEKENISYIKFTTKNWMNGRVEYHYYQGTWETIKEDDIFKLLRSNIEEIDEPDYGWYFDWD